LRTLVDRDIDRSFSDTTTYEDKEQGRETDTCIAHWYKLHHLVIALAALGKPSPDQLSGQRRLRSQRNRKHPMVDWSGGALR
jgi:hypothetical protein